MCILEEITTNNEHALLPLFPNLQPFFNFFTFHLWVVDYKRAFPKVWASFPQITVDLQYSGVYKGECEIRKNKNAGTSRLF